MLQESLVLWMVVIVRASMKVFLEKVASNLALMFLKTPPGSKLNEGETNGST